MCKNVDLGQLPLITLGLNTRCPFIVDELNYLFFNRYVFRLWFSQCTLIVYFDTIADIHCQRFWRCELASCCHGKLTWFCPFSLSTISEAPFIHLLYFGIILIDCYCRRISKLYFHTSQKLSLFVCIIFHHLREVKLAGIPDPVSPAVSDAAAGSSSCREAVSLRNWSEYVDAGTVHSSGARIGLS